MYPSLLLYHYLILSHRSWKKEEGGIFLGSFLTVRVIRRQKSPVSRVRHTPRGIVQVVARAVVHSISRLCTITGKRVTASNLLVNIVR